MNTLSERRIFSLFCLAFALLLLLGARLAYLQLVKGKRLAAAAVEEHTLRFSVANFLRGDIQDCRGRSLLDGQEVYGVAVFPALLPSFPEAEEFPSGGITRREDLYIEKLLAALPQRYRHRELRAFLRGALFDGIPFLLPVTLKRQEIGSLTVGKTAGIYLVPLPRRYGDSSLARHLVGYVKGSVPGEDRQKGVKGIEAAYDSVLRPPVEKMELLTVVDGRGEPLEGRGLRLRGPGGEISGGGHVVLTLDYDVQAKVEEIMDKYGIKGAVAAVDVATGEVRALASRPQYDQQSGTGDQFDRSLALYHPGSVFKIVVAAAALAEGKVRPEEIFFCSGKYSFNNREGISCWKEEGHGTLTFKEAFARSCNPVFVEVALRLGGKTLEHYARLLGVEKGLEDYLSHRRLGSVRIGSYPGQVGNAALGQEGVLVSPLNAAVLAGTIARGGTYIRPSIVKAITTADGRTVKAFSSDRPQRVLPNRVAGKLQEMMALTVKEGTGMRAGYKGVEVYGKTGSAETGRRNAAGNSMADSWFVGYARGDGKWLAVAVVVEDGGAGGGIAADVFREIIKEICHTKGI